MKTDVFNGIQPSNEIWYTTFNESLVWPMKYVGQAEVVKNKYDNGKGIMVFDRDMTDDVITIMNDDLTAISFPDSYSFKRFLNSGCYIFFTCKKLERIKYAEGDGRFLCVDNTIVNVANSNLESIVLPEGIRVKEGAFIGENDKLEVVHIGKGSSLMEGAFVGLSNIKKIYGEHSTSGKNAWIEDTTLLAFATGAHDHSEIPEGVTRIGRHAFADSHLKSVKIPGSVSSVGFNAFGKLSDVRMIGKNVDKNKENLIVDGKLLLHFNNPELPFLHPAVIPEEVKEIDSNVSLFNCNTYRESTVEFQGALPPMIMFHESSALEQKRQDIIRYEMECYSAWKSEKATPRNVVAAVLYQQFDNGFVPSPEDKHILVKIIVPKGSIEEYQNAFKPLGEKVIEISEKN